MTRMLVFFAFLTSFIFAGASAYAVTSGAQSVRLKYASTNVTTSAYVELLHSTTRGIKAVSVASSGLAPVQLAFGAAGSEINQIIVPVSSSLVPVVYPLVAGYATRVSVISLDGTDSTGELDVNLFYN